MKPRIAIIGAGMAGLTLGQSLCNRADIEIFEKSRGVGGRMSTRYADPFMFDHGTQFFTARTKEFQAFLAPFITSGDVAEWKGKVIGFDASKQHYDRLWFEPHYVACPNMNSLCKRMSEGLTIHVNTEVSPLKDKIADQWQLYDKNGNSLGIFDWVISTAPPAQTAKLFSQYLHDALFTSAAMLGCYTLMIGFTAPWDKNWIAAKVKDSPLEWIAINSSKPGRNASITSIVVHSSNAWAEEHINDDMKESEQFLVHQFETVTGIDCTKTDYLSTHRWRYALLAEPHNHDPYIDAALKIASAGDWCRASRIEDTWIAAKQLASNMGFICDL